MKRLNLKNSYYYRDVSPLWRIIVLDTVDVSVDREESHSNHALAIEWLKENRHRANAVEWNGGIGPEQLHWLKNVLEETKKEERLAIVCGHIPIVSGTKSEQHTVWDSDVIVELFAAFQTTVKAYFAGHYHEGCYAFKDNIHYVTFEAVLDADHDDGSCGVVLLHKDHIKVEGNGTMTSRTLVL